MTHLFDIQKWFGAMIAQPLQDNQLLPAYSPFGTDTKQEAEKYIAPSKTLQPFERIQIYHQQYWWRLLKCMQTNFPTVTRLFGYDAFQKELAIPYLATNPPADWALCKLGATFPEWLDHHYHQQDRYLVCTASTIDWAAEKAFWIGAIPCFDFSQEEVWSKRLVLQPHVHLFNLKADFLSFRDEFLKYPPEHYSSNPFPEMTYEESHFVLYRATNNVVRWKRLSPSEHWMLMRFKEGNTIEKACEELEEIGGEILEEAFSQLPFWFKQWTVLEWFGQS